jgi:hypothetical protein
LRPSRRRLIEERELIEQLPGVQHDPADDQDGLAGQEPAGADESDPASVRLTWRLVRSNRRRTSSASSALICWLSPG